ncbi:hypothetical protein GALL_64210 [mine drainage metagenome]|uniref:Uncharacterized protein n=1 Tax=mine drainage metagenome TaxID=410659 RepID=A0A1J5SUF3_9ZZZZ
MENDFRDKQRKSYSVMRMTYDLTMAVFLLGMAVVMFFGDRFKIIQIMDVDKTFRYFFGSICLLYGGFRLYRGIKSDY